MLDSKVLFWKRACKKSRTTNQHTGIPWLGYNVQISYCGEGQRDPAFILPSETPWSKRGNNQLKIVPL